MKVIKAVADYIIVLKKGIIIEEGKKDIVFSDPRTDYTKKLLQAVI